MLDVVAKQRSCPVVSIISAFTRRFCFNGMYDLFTLLFCQKFFWLTLAAIFNDRYSLRKILLSRDEGARTPVIRHCFDSDCVNALIYK